MPEPGNPAAIDAMSVAPRTTSPYRAPLSAHHLLNRSNQEVAYLEIGTRLAGDVVTYPNEDLEAINTGGGKWEFLHKDGSPYSS
ncbi:MAG: hypothetical protein Q7T25_00525 [Sideroxyarcus sp.]|nr:hypothetical protein [Sideroxyarcus sp.]